MGRAKEIQWHPIVKPVAIIEGRMFAVGYFYVSFVRSLDGRPLIVELEQPLSLN